MEQKEKLKQIFRLSRFLPVSLGAVSAALLVRILQLNLAVDFATGFFQEDTFLVPLLAVILLLYLAYAVIVLLLHPLRLEQPYKMKNPLPAAVIFGAAGILLLLEGNHCLVWYRRYAGADYHSAGGCFWSRTALSCGLALEKRAKTASKPCFFPGSGTLVSS